MKRITIVTLLSLLLYGGLPCWPIEAHRDIPDDHLATCVLLTLKNNSVGSGFFFNFGNLCFLVTARHVLFDDKQNLRAEAAEALSYTSDPKNPSQFVLTFDLKALESAGQLKGHSSGDVAVIHVATSTVAGGSNEIVLVNGVGVKVSVAAAPPAIKGFAASSAKMFDDVLTANQVYVFGYPISLALQNTGQFDFTRPLITDFRDMNNRHLNITFGNLVTESEN